MKILTALALALSIAIISCAPLEEKVVDPMKVVAAQITSPGGPSQAEFTTLRLKVERLEKLLERQIDKVDSLNYAKVNHSHLAKNNTNRDHTHDQYLEKGYGFARDYADRNHTHPEYASTYHSHGGGFGGFP